MGSDLEGLGWWKGEGQERPVLILALILTSSTAQAPCHVALVLAEAAVPWGCP